MDRELLLEIGCEELPASWLAPLTKQLGDRLAAQLAALPADARGPDRNLQHAAPPDGRDRAHLRASDRSRGAGQRPAGVRGVRPRRQPTPAAIGFARKNGVEVSRAGAGRRRRKGPISRSRAVSAARPRSTCFRTCSPATLRELAFPKLMHWDAWLDDGRGELLFGRPIRWILFLYGGRVVPFVVRRSALAQSGAGAGSARRRGDLRPSLPRRQRPRRPRDQGAQRSTTIARSCSRTS